jgi:hypothetical protein
MLVLVVPSLSQDCLDLGAASFAATLNVCRPAGNILSACAYNSPVSQ